MAESWRMTRRKSNGEGWREECATSSLKTVAVVSLGASSTMTRFKICNQFCPSQTQGEKWCKKEPKCSIKVCALCLCNTEPLKIQRKGALISLAPQEDKMWVGRPIRRLTQSSMRIYQKADHSGSYRDTDKQRQIRTPLSRTLQLVEQDREEGNRVEDNTWLPWAPTGWNSTLWDSISSLLAKIILKNQTKSNQMKTKNWESSEMLDNWNKWIYVMLPWETFLSR